MTETQPHWLNCGPMPDGDATTPLERAMERAEYICYFFHQLENLETEPCKYDGGSFVCNFLGGSFKFLNELIQVTRASSEARH